MTRNRAPFRRLLLASLLAHGAVCALPGTRPPAQAPELHAIEVALGSAPPTPASTPPAPARRAVTKARPKTAPAPAPRPTTAESPPSVADETPAPPSDEPATTAPASHAPAPSASADDAPAAASEAASNAVSGAAPSVGQLPYARYAPRPPYPEAARRQTQEGKVRVRVLIGEDGTVRQTRLAASSGYPELDRAALETLPRWRFSPARRDGKAIDAWVVVPVVFALH